VDLYILQTCLIYLLLQLLTCTHNCCFMKYLKIFWFILWSKVVCFAVFLKNFVSASVFLDLSCFFSVQFSLLCSKVSIADVLCICSLVYFMSLQGFGTFLMIPVICKNSVNLCIMLFSLHVTASQPVVRVCLFCCLFISYCLTSDGVSSSEWHCFSSVIEIINLYFVCFFVYILL